VCPLRDKYFSSFEGRRQECRSSQMNSHDMNTKIPIARKDNPELESYLKQFKYSDEVSLLCANCSQHFTKRKRLITGAFSPSGEGKAMYCSHECMIASRTTKMQASCARCGVFYYRTLSKMKRSQTGLSFCSRKCGALYLNSVCDRKGSDRAALSKIAIFCDFCNASLTRTKLSLKNFCDAKCHQQFLWEKRKEKYVALGYFPHNSCGKSKIGRRFLLELHGHKCSICKGETWMGAKIPLVLDHIDGNSDNHKISNLRMVCRNCDGLLPTFAGRNTGKGHSTSRMKRLKSTTAIAD
jgi:hypothetical protein